MKIKLLLFTLFLALTCYPQDGEEITIIKELDSGWNLIGYHGSVPMIVDSALSSIWDKLEVVKNLEGYYLMGQDNFLNSLDTMKLGEGYWVKVSDNCQLRWSVLRHNYPPTEPIAIFPLNGAVNVDTSFFLRWSSSDHETEMLTYTILLDGNNPPETELVSSSVQDSLSVSNLEYDSTYYWQIIVLDEFGHEVESDVFSFRTKTNCSLTDIDGNTYPCAQFGTQIWMTQNLRVSRYADGTSIAYLPETTDWDTVTAISKAFCFYDTIGTGYELYNTEIFGGLYTWAAATNNQSSETNPSNLQGICPDGWHMPSDEEWTQLERFIAENGYAYDNTQYDGSETNDEARLKIAKAMATDWGWQHSTIEGSIGNNDYELKRNSTNFSIVPAGQNIRNGNYIGIGRSTGFWTASNYNYSQAKQRIFQSSVLYVLSSTVLKHYASSIRCVKD